MRHLDTQELAIFLAVVDHGGFTAAAGIVNRSQATVSLTVSRLEERLGQHLLIRSRQGVSLTPAGEILISYARRLLSIEDEALFALDISPERGTRVRVGMPDDYLGSCGEALIEHFSADEQIQVDIVCDFSHRLEQRLVSGTLDMAIITRTADSPRGDLLFSVEQRWCAAPDHFPEHLSPLPVVLFVDECRSRPGVLKALDERGLHWRLVSSSSHLPGVLAAVRGGHGLTVLPVPAIPADWRCPQTTLPSLPFLEIAMIVPEGSRVATRHVAQFLKQHYRPDSPHESDRPSRAPRRQTQAPSHR